MNTKRMRLVAGAVTAAAVAVVVFDVSLSTILFVGALLACPLMMAGMHGGHRGHGHAHHRPAEEEPRKRGVV